MKHYTKATVLMVIRSIFLFTIFNCHWGIISGFASEPGKHSLFNILPEERILIRTDREVYIAGENLFYSMRILCLNEKIKSPASKIAYIIIRNANNNIVITAISKMVNDFSSGSVLLSDTFSSGLYQISVYTNLMRNLGDAFYFHKVIYIANRFDKQLKDFKNNIESYNKKSLLDSVTKVSSVERDSTGMQSEILQGQNSSHGISQVEITTGKSQYNKRERICADVNANSQNDDSIIHLSISVAESLSLKSPFNMDSSNTYRLQNAEFGAYNNEKYLQLFSNRNIQKKKTDSLNYLPEFNGYLLKGRVIDIMKKVPAQGIYVLISTPDTILNLDYAITDVFGQFYFYINDYYEGKKLILNIKGKTEKISDYKLEVDDKFNLDSPFRSANLQMNPALKDFILRSQQKVWIQKVYETNHNIIGPASSTSSIIPVIYSRPQYIIYPDDYTEFSDFMEMSKNIIPGVRLRKENNQYTLNLLGMDNDFQKYSSPTVFLDGVLIDDLSKIVYMGSDKIAKIEMVKSAWIYGDIEFHGILSIFSKKNEIDNIKLPPTSLVVNISNFAKNDRIKFPNYSENSELSEDAPDFRQLLYWDPDLCVQRNGNKKIEFYSSDLSGKYIIKASGITSKGRIIESECEISIGPN